MHENLSIYETKPLTQCDAEQTGTWVLKLWKSDTEGVLFFLLYLIIG